MSKKGKFQNNTGKISQKKIIAVLSVICVILLFLVIFMLIQINKDPEITAGISTTGDSVQSTASKETNESYAESRDDQEIMTTFGSEEAEESEHPDETNAHSTGNIKPNGNKETKPKETTPQQTQPKETDPEEDDPNPTQNQQPTQRPQQSNTPDPTPPAPTEQKREEEEFTEPTDPEPEKTVISLPYTIPGTDLVVSRVASYDGIYMEDGSNSNVSGVAMMLLKNTGSQAVEYVEITMQYDDKTLVFTASAIPANSQAIVQAKEKKTCATGDLIACTANVAYASGLGMSADKVSVVDNGDNSLTVTNLTDQEIVTVRVFYKYYMADEAVYVGGITYTAKISNLAAGASVTVTPSHYTSEAGKIMMVRTYDTDA